MIKLLKKEMIEDFSWDNEQEIGEQITTTDLWQYDTEREYLDHKRMLERCGWREAEKNKQPKFRCVTDENGNKKWYAAYSQTHQATVNNETMEFLSKVVEQ